MLIGCAPGDSEWCYDHADEGDACCTGRGKQGYRMAATASTQGVRDCWPVEEGDGKGWSAD